ncbi:MAG: mandelate racemase/muconate lactonizing enzyme family protein, partial [Comamonadaceae bacterium]
GCDGHLGYVQPDVGKWGGISGCRDVALAAAALGPGGPVFCPHWLAGGVGLAASLHLRAAMGDGGFAEIDANPNPLRDALWRIPVVDGHIHLPQTPGIGVEPDPAWLAAHEVRA